MSHIHLPSGSNEVHKARYLQFISSRPVRDKNRKKGFELHHIWPRSLGGPCTKENVILLTPREHYLAHLMLWKAYGGPMTYAFFMMANRMSISLADVVSARQYDKVRQEVSKLRSAFRYSKESKARMSESAKARPHKPCSEETKKKIGEANRGKTSWAKGQKKSEETRAKMKEAQKDRKPISEETRKKLRESHLGQKASKDSCKKRSESGKQAWIRRKAQEVESARHQEGDMSRKTDSPD